MVIQDTPAVKGYEIQEPIGEGAYGVVYRALQPFVDREVALKVIQPEFANQPEFIRRFEAEAQLVAQLEHLHIVPLYDYWRDPQGAYLVMRLMQGGNLAELLLDGPMELTRAVQLIDQVTSALHVAHQQGIVHRDLKPANILFDQAGNAYLSDFGIAKAISSQPGLTTTGAILGSPAYMSPEQVQSQSISPQTDIYALGILLFEILTGKHPFPETSSGSMLVKQVNAPLPLVKPFRPELPVEVDHVIQRATAKDPADRYADALVFTRELRRALNLEISSPIALDKELVNPYKGLRAFQEADADDFFGRNALVEDLIARLRGPGEYSRFLAVVGPSGSGKSSVVKAGLIPALRRGGLPGSENWFYVSLQPGPYPLEELEIALLRSTASSQNIIEQLQRDSRGLIRSARLVLPDEKSQLCLVIDQFEELFTLVEDSKIRDQVMDLIYESISFPKSQLRVIITLRADFYDRPLLHDKFSRLIEARTALVLPLTNQELQSAIQSPAERAGAILEKGVVPAIINDVSNQPGGLPLLQYALTELFDRRSGRMLNCQSYGLIGGLAGALGGRAEQIYTSLDQQTQQTAKQLFLRLVTIGEGVDDTRRRISWSEVEQLPSEHLLQVSDIYGQARLLTFDHDPASREATIEVAHEALLKEWERLARWLDESRGDLRMQRALSELAADWLAAEKDPSYLLRGSRLGHFEEWAENSTVKLSANEKVFLEASSEARQLREEVELERRQRELEQVSIGLAAQALQELEGSSPERSVLLALEALENYPYTWQAERALGQAVLRDRLRMVLIHDGFVNTAAWSQDGSRILTGSEDGTVRLWDVLSGKEMWRISEGKPDSACWSPDYRLILMVNQMEAYFKIWDCESHTELVSFHREELKDKISGNVVSNWKPWSPSCDYFGIYADNGTVSIFDTKTGKRIHNLSNHQGIVSQAIWSPDGELIASSGFEDGKIIIWNAESGKELYFIEANLESENIIFANWSPSGDQFAIRGQGGVKIFDTGSGRLLKHLNVPQVWILGVWWSPDNNLILTSGKHDGVARFWDAKSGQQLSSIEELVQAMGSTWSPCSNYAVVGGADSALHLWNRTANREVDQLTTKLSYSQFVDFSPDGNQILAYGSDNTVNILEMSSAHINIHQKSHGHVSDIAWSPNGEQVTSGKLVPPDYSIKIINSRTGSEMLELSTDAETASVSWAPKGNRILTTNHKVVIWDAHTGKELQKISGHKDRIREARWSPDGTRIATGSYDSEIIIWEYSTGEEWLRFSSHEDNVLSVAWSPDGTRILSTAAQGEAMIWDAFTGKLLINLMPEDFLNPVPDAEWSSDGKNVYVLTADGDVITFDSDSGNLLGQFSTTPTSFVARFSVSPSEERIVIGGHDGEVKVWDMVTGRELITYEARGYSIASYSPDGKWILIEATEGHLGSLQVVPTWHSTQELIDYARKHKVFRMLAVEERERFGLPAINSGLVNKGGRDV